MDSTVFIRPNVKLRKRGKAVKVPYMQNSWTVPPIESAKSENMTLS
jgi:hypothetical protein